MFGLGNDVEIIVSGERGVVTGEARHMRSSQKQYFVEYRAADGRPTEAWFFEDQIRDRSTEDMKVDELDF